MSTSTSSPSLQNDTARAGVPATPPAPKLPLKDRVRNLPPTAKAGFFVVAILIAVAWYVFSGRVTTDDAQVDCHITAVAPQVPGYVVRLHFNDNTPVKAGELLVEIDARPYEAEVQQAKAGLAVAEAQANSAKIHIQLTRETTSHS